MWNEQGSVGHLIEQIDKTFRKTCAYEVIVVDDNSTDGSVQLVLALSSKYPVHIFKKEGKKGKAQSIYEGLKHVKYPIIAMIDADLQYPPRDLLPMMYMIEQKQADVVVAHRREQGTSQLRKLVHNTCRIALGKLLHGLDYDIQSGMKVFNTKAASIIGPPQSAWAFDLEFLVAAQAAGLKIAEHDIRFAKRQADTSKINILEGTWQIASSAFKLKYQRMTKKRFHI